MNLLLIIIVAFIIGFTEWYLALRRTLALTHGERRLTFFLVLVEGILAWLVLSSFLNVPIYPISPSDQETSSNLLLGFWNLIVAYRWRIAIAISASLGGACGSLMVNRKPKDSK